ncbi:ubiquitin-protein ligase E3B [Drosophila pseudoobscura]|uniref:Ubiquitin-protein ligase E3B n=1 Tax=Drosophila pseudoobscura pseudoobscura TaxID=46245 RepID=A0A6I8UEI5_DROPS|nr:ubiquitin-protein ligase E3B [Drosophila pseudoobscura]
MFAQTESQKTSFLEQTKAAREERALEKRRELAAILLQSTLKGYASRRKYQKRIINDFDAVFVPGQDEKDTELELTAVNVYPLLRRYLTQIKLDKKNMKARERLEIICRYVNKAMEAENTRLSYAALCLHKERSLPWIAHIKILLTNCLLLLPELKPENHADSLSLALFLHTLIVFTSPKSWAILRNATFGGLQPAMQKVCCNIQGHLVQHGFYKTMRLVLLRGTAREELSVKSVTLVAIITLCLRPLIDGDYSRNLLSQFLSEIVSVPALVYHLNQSVPQCIEQLSSMGLLKKALSISEDFQWFEEFGASMPGTKSLAFLGNIVNLFNIDGQAEAKVLAYPLLIETTTTLLELIPNTVTTKGVFTQWHELLGWHTPGTEPAQNQNVSLIKKQFHMLWDSRCIKVLLGDFLKDINVNYERIEFQSPQQPSTSNLLRRALERSSNCGVTLIGGGTASKQSKQAKQPWRKLDSADVVQVSRICGMYYAALSTLSQMKLDILTGICYNDNVLYDIWLMLTSLGPNCGMKEYLDLLKSETSLQKPQTAMLMLFCDCMTHYVTILDEYEMYTEQNPFRLNDYVMLTYFLNNMLYKLINDNILGAKNIVQNPVFLSLHTLLLCLYRRDCRRPFTPTNHWLIPEVKPSTFINDLEKAKRNAMLLLAKMPHIIPHDDRVKLFRKFVQNEKAVMGLTESACASPRSALIVIHRERIVEDGYRQLAAQPTQALKGVIRVRFINQQGLHEAGIDQDGVFKEFLEETIKKVFDPSLNLFKTTSDQRLYPSPISYVQDNHLQLFEFVGRMLGKAVYEGIVVDVPFASFFLSQLLGQTQQALYSCMDELPSLDAELYRSLTFIKHYKQDVAELNLTFSVDQDVMGKIVTHELHPGGKGRVVNDHNKLVYIHYMAYFHMNTQIREQTQAFNRGFRSIVNPEWLSLFSPPELQRLISGDTAPLDLRDLRKHTQYYGGFHDSHRVVGWLWDILGKDFTEEERKLFLKFVTSCSKPPLLGFAHLEPPFSIRCVEVGDDEDTGDTIGSVIRGFFTIRKKDPLNRLPTSSTCFNLLKLPNYQKKSTLRDKLRYAVSSNTGFELS